MFNIALYDDSQEDQLLFQNYIRKFFENRQVSYEIHCFSSFPADINNIEEYDIIFLDIEVGSANGIQFGQTIK